MKQTIRVLHTEWSNGWGGQEIRIVNEMLAVKGAGIEVFLACKDDSMIKQKVLNQGIKVFLLPFRGNTDLKTLFGLYKIIKQNQIDIVNTHSGKDTWVGGFAAKIAGVKFIRTRHLSNRIKSSRLNFINELADFIFTTGESVRADMIQFNRINADKIMSIPTGINEDYFNEVHYDRKTCRTSYGMDNDEIAVGIVAVLRAFKRHDRFIQLAKRIIEDESVTRPVRFYIAGDGPQRQALVELIYSLNMENHIIMLGHVSEVPVLLKALDIIVLTSDSNEGVPQSVMQALMMNKAVVSTDAGSTGDLYNKDNFLLVNKNDREAMYLSLLGLINDEELRKNYSKKARIFVADNFSEKAMVQKIISVYKMLTQES